MPAAAVDSAIKARLAASWTESVVVGGSRPGDPSELATDPPASVDAFLVVQYPVVNGAKPVLHGRYFEEGAARLVLNVKREVGIAVSLGWADTLAGLFREYRNGSFETFVPDTAVVDDANDDGNWIVYSVIVPYRYQFAEA